MRWLFQELKKSFYLPYMLFSIIGVVILCLLAQCYTDYSSGTTYSVFSMILNREKFNVMEQASLNCIEVWNAGMGNWFYLFSPILLTVGYLIIISNERNTEAIRFILIREGMGKYCLSKVISAAAFSGTMMLLGYAIYGLLIMPFFPTLSSFPEDVQTFYLEYVYLSKSVLIYVVKRLVGVFLYGAFVSVFSVGISIAFRDPYMLICLPFLFKYVYTQLMSKVSYEATISEQEKLAEIVRGFMPESILSVGYNTSFWISLVFLVCLFGLIDFEFYRTMKVRRDNGAFK